jgi:nitrous oxidase accessory protein
VSHLPLVVLRLPGLPLLIGALALVAAPARAQRPETLHVGAGHPYTRIADAVAAAGAAARVVLHAGVYREPTVVLSRPLVLQGEPGAVVDGQGLHTVILVEADDVTVEGLTITNTGVAQVEERAGIKVRNARRCRIRGNRLTNTLFGIYLERTSGCEVQDNVLVGSGGGQMTSGNGIHAWYSDTIRVAGNQVRGHRDGIYFEFVTEGRVLDNVSEGSARYGMHFMFSNDCRYERNTYRANGNGVAVMYSRNIVMLGNRFEKNWGSAAYGLLLKNINDSEVRDNEFVANSVGLYLEDSGRNRVDGNAFRENGWALKVLASAQGNTFEGNTFERNAFDVGTNSRSNVSTFRGNYWDQYRGYDLDHDGVGDVPYLPVRLFALIVEQSPASLVLLRSLLVDLLDLAERAIPALTPVAVRDDAPLLTPPRRGRGR